MAAVAWRYPVEMTQLTSLPPLPPPPAATPPPAPVFAPETLNLRYRIDGDGDEGLEAVNYRIRGKYYIVDRLFRKAELSLGSGWTQKKVVITRQTPIAAVNFNGGPNG